MSRISIVDFRSWFSQILDDNDECVVVYSGIWTFGHKFDIPVRDVPRVLVEKILEAIGPHRTLLLPAYTYSFAKNRRYSPRESMPETGILSTTFLRQFPSIRTHSALNSFLAIGPRAEFFSQIKGNTIWGDSSAKGVLEKTNARMVTLGLPWKDSLGFLHRIEEKAEVPYRYFKTFHGQWVDADITAPWAETMYVRSIEVIPEFDWSRVDRRLRQQGRIITADAPILIESAGAADIVSSGVELLADNPYALLTNEPKVRRWVVCRKDREIAELRAKESGTLDYFDHIAAARV